MVEDAGARAVTVHGRTAAQSYSGSADWDLVAEVANALTIPVFGSGDCVTPEQIVARLASGVDGVLVGRGVLRNPWILAQAADLLAGLSAREVTLAERGQFLLDYIELLMHERVREDRPAAPAHPAQKSHDRWVVNKLRALGAYYTKGIETGSEFRSALNTTASLDELRELIGKFFHVRM
jgi:tRNA-dihydrouridine synthase B